MSQFLKIYEENPNQRHIGMVVDCLKKGGIVVIPTDTVYAFACDMYNAKALDKLCLLTGKKREKSNFSFICYDLKHIADYAKQIDNQVFKLMKSLLPGPYTFILEANSSVPKMIRKKTTVGIRVPANQIARTLVKELGNPIMSASLKSSKDNGEYMTDPELIFEEFENQVDMVIDGGYGGYEPSTVINCLDNEIKLIRAGKGKIKI
ncbi:MAG: threonylcarbamoyl-AMP synthase [Bacteroidales bacterium]|jgi:tRNA threonylcarbamoyl adenosine modification protein (Sua5/YciO/YrdC/YwlC family)|nr:threonylcarbamoyl-AMP synthase [Bacteroidales bacterium]